MDGDVNVLTWLLGPIDPSLFIERYLTKELYIGAQLDPERFTGLLSLEQYYGIIAGLRATDETFQHRPSLAHRIRLGGSADYVDMAGVLSGYAQGSTVFLDELERKHPPVGKLCERLTRGFFQLGHPLLKCGPATVFLTPVRSQALDPHSDPADLFILQLEGMKHWRFYGSAPLAKLPGRWLDQLPPVSHEVTLTPGMAVYIPRGVIHHARTSDEHSLAITIGFTPLTWHELVRGVLREVEQSLTSDSSLVRSEDILSECLSSVGVAKLVSAARSIVEGAPFRAAAEKYTLPRLAAAGTFGAINELNQITTATWLQAAGKLEFAAVEDKATLRCGRAYVTGPVQSLGGVFKALSLAGERVPVAGLSGSEDPEVNIRFARRLVIEGLYVVASGSQANPHLEM